MFETLSGPAMKGVKKTNNFCSFSMQSQTLKNVSKMNYVGNEENVCRDLQQYQNILDTFYQL